AALEEGGKVSPAYLGVSPSDAASGGATVRSVSAGGPAARAGLKTGQTIVRVGSMTIGSSDDLASAVDARSPGDHVKVTVRSGGGPRHRQGPPRKTPATGAQPRRGAPGKGGRKGPQGRTAGPGPGGGPAAPRR